MGIFCFDFNPSSKYGVAKASLKLKQLKLPVGAVCGRCKEVLEWKKKYDKYKPLTAPGRWSVAELYHFLILFHPRFLILCFCRRHADVSVFIATRKPSRMPTTRFAFHVAPRVVCAASAELRTKCCHRKPHKLPRPHRPGA